MVITVETVLAAISAAEQLYTFVTTAKATMDATDAATIDAALEASILRRHAQQAKTDAALDAAAQNP